jgi:hypothetical protein
VIVGELKKQEMADIAWMIQANQQLTAMVVQLTIRLPSGKYRLQRKRFVVSPTTLRQTVERWEQYGLTDPTLRQLLSDLTRLAAKLRVSGFPSPISRASGSLWDRIQEITGGSPI